jgi:hypothetical protein
MAIGSRLSFMFRGLCAAFRLQAALLEARQSIVNPAPLLLEAVDGRP